MKIWMRWHLSAQCLVCGLVGLLISLGPSAAEVEPDPFALTAGALADALAGKELTYRGQIFAGPVSANFAEGYVSAIAETAHASGAWCGAGKILPHELMSRVFDQLSEGQLSSPAGPAVTDALKKIHPCP
jgi:hypothetical protein